MALGSYIELHLPPADNARDNKALARPDMATFAALMDLVHRVPANNADRPAVSFPTMGLHVASALSLLDETGTARHSRNRLGPNADRVAEEVVEGIAGIVNPRPTPRADGKGKDLQHPGRVVQLVHSDAGALERFIQDSRVAVFAISRLTSPSSFQPVPFGEGDVRQWATFVRERQGALVQDGSAPGGFRDETFPGHLPHFDYQSKSNGQAFSVYIRGWALNGASSAMMEAGLDSFGLCRPGSRAPILTWKDPVDAGSGRSAEEPAGETEATGAADFDEAVGL